MFRPVTCELAFRQDPTTGFSPKTWDLFPETQVGENPQFNHVGPGQ
jgi:hypothetical protein